MRRALVLLAAALAGVTLGGWWLSATWHLSFAHGMYCAVGLASTEGCDAVPQSGSGRLAAVVLIVILIPILAAVYALVTSAHIGGKVRDSEERIKKHFAEELARHHQGKDAP